MIEVQNLSKVYEGKNAALKKVSFSLPEKGFVFCVGKSGSGKTTLMNLLTGLDKPTEGCIVFEGNSVENAAENEWNALRNTRMGIVFQDFALFEERSVYDNLAMALDIADIKEIDYDTLILNVLNELDISELRDRECNRLSAGQKQRVAIARALMKSPSLIIADEATGNLDEENAEQVLEVLNRIAQKRLVILICHNTEYADRYADIVLKLKDGEVMSFRDNSKIKSVAQQGLSVHDLNTQNVVPLNEFNLTRYVASEIEGNLVLQPVELKLRVTPNKKREKEDEYRATTKEPQKLSRKNIRKNVVEDIKERKGRMLFSVLIIAILGMVNLFVNLIRNNDYVRLILDYTRDFKCVYLNYESESQERITNGKLLTTEIEEKVGASNIFRVKNDIYIEKAENYFQSKIAYNMNDDNPNLALTEGIWFKNEQACVLTGCLAKALQANVGAVVNVEGVELEVSGIVDVDDYICFLSNQRGKDCPEIDTCAFFATDVTMSSNVDSFAYSMTVVGKKSNLIKSDAKILEGRVPQADNEVIISASLAQKSFDWPNGKVISHQRLVNLHSEKYGMRYGNLINISEYTSNNVVIVGVYDDMNEEENCGDVVFSDDVFEKILRDYVEYLSFQSIMVVNSKQTRNVIREFDGKRIYVDAKNTEYIYDMREIMQRIKGILWSGVIICGVIIWIVIAVCFGSWIRERKKTIGRFRALGYKNGDIFKIFMTSGSIMALISTIASIALVILLVCAVNASFGRIINDRSIAVVAIGVTNVVLNALIMVFVGAAAMIVQLKAYNKTKPIELLR